MPYPAVSVANEFLRIAEEKKQGLSPMKLQKLVYFAHGWYLALTGKPLVTERIEAWQYGPVIPTLYREFKGYGNSDITSPVREVSQAPDGGFLFEEPSLDDYAMEGDEVESARKIIRRVWDVYGSHSAIKLSNATHMPGTPWEQVYKQGARSLTIGDQVIERYFKELAHGPQ